MKYRQWKKNYKKRYGQNPSIVIDKRKQRRYKARWQRRYTKHITNFMTACLRLSAASYRTASAIGAFFGKAQAGLIGK